MSDHRNQVIEEKLKSMLCMNTTNLTPQTIKTVEVKNSAQNIIISQNSSIRPPGSYPSDTKFGCDIMNINTPGQTQQNKKRKPRKRSNSKGNKQTQIVNLTDNKLEENSVAILDAKMFQQNNPPNNFKHNDDMLALENQFESISIHNKKKLPQKQTHNKPAFKELSLHNESQIESTLNLKSHKNEKVRDELNHPETPVKFGIEHTKNISNKKENIYFPKMSMVNSAEVNSTSIDFKAQNMNENNLENMKTNISNQIKSDVVSKSLTEEKFEKHGIFLLKKKNPNFPNAKYFCRVCNYHLDNESICFKHSNESTHLHHFNAKKKKVPTATLR